MLTYHYTLTPDDNGTLLIQFPDVPEAAAVADSEADAPAQATEGLEAALQLYIDARRPLPVAAYLSGPAVRIKALATAKLLLADQMVAQGVKKVELARMLGIHPPQVDRLLDLGHGSKIETVEAALEALDRQVEIVVRPATPHARQTQNILAMPEAAQIDFEIKRVQDLPRAVDLS